MQVVEISKPGAPDVLRVAYRDKPVAGPDQVLIKVAAAGVNRPDVLQRLGLYPPPPGASDIPGLEIAGTIESVGDGVTGWHRGDSVCALVPGGGYAEYCVADVGCCLPVPDRLTLLEAASIPETYFTVWYNVFERGLLEHGDTFLVHGGSSGIGVAAIQLAKAFGASAIATAGSDEKTAFCLNLGADAAINYNTQDFVKEVASFTNGKGVDVLLDMVGGDYVERNTSCLAEHGRHISIAFQRGLQGTFDIMQVMRKRLTFTGSTLRAQSVSEKSMIAESLSLFVWPLFETGEVKPVIDSVFPFADAKDAHALMESNKHKGKVMLSFD